MKYITIIILAFITHFSFGQENSIYFPQEQLLHPDCAKNIDPSSCLYSIYNKEITSLLSKTIADKPYAEDTLRVHLGFSVDKKGKIIKELNRTFINDSLLAKNVNNQLNTLLYKSPKFKILNRKPNKYQVSHNLNFEYTVSNKELNFIPIGKPYRGGDIFEFPIYTGCEGKNGSQGRLCFNKKVQEHLRRNFHYPEEAQKLKLEGKVYIIFKINPQGKVDQIRTRGPHKILEDEAVRIIELIPKMQPGKLNGEPTEVPFSIPIAFKLE